MVLVLVIDGLNACWCSLLSSQFLTIVLCFRLLCRLCTTDVHSAPFSYIIQPCFMGLPRLFVPSMIPNITDFISSLSPFVVTHVRID